MNINTKALLAGTLLTSLLAGTSAIAGDNDHFAKADYATNTESVIVQKVSYQSALPETGLVGDNSYLFEDENYSSNTESRVNYQSALLETDSITEINR